jgi:menaquinone-specific isochorismate synthase
MTGWTHSAGEALAPAAARDTLAALIDQACESARRWEGPAPTALRVEVPIEPRRPLGWLAAQQASPRLYWRDRRAGWDVAAVGAADRVGGSGDIDTPAAIAHVRSVLATAHPNLHYYGGIRFDRDRAAAPGWDRFGAYQFILPAFELRRRGDQVHAACNLLLWPGEGIDAARARALDQLETLDFDAEAAPGDPGRPIRSLTHTPGRDAWAQAVADALAAFTTTPLRKVVLARETRVEPAAPPDALALLERLIRVAAHTYAFAFEPAPGTVFFGASPERLYRRHEHFVETEAVAGTRPRGATDAADAALGAELLASEKDRREHGYVADSIEAGLAPFCRALEADAGAQLLQLHRCQHLCRRFEGILREGIDDEPLLKALHPTPAVGGWPTEEALAHIRRAEPFDRGWYAGPIGWAGPEGAEFAVGIRSGLIHEGRLSLYAGAGIVAGSQADREWNELDSKLSTFLGVVGGDGA